MQAYKCLLHKALIKKKKIKGSANNCRIVAKSQQQQQRSVCCKPKINIARRILGASTKRVGVLGSVK